MRKDAFVVRRLLQPVHRMFGRRARARAGRSVFIVEPCKELLDLLHTKAAAIDIALTGDGELKGISAAGTGTRKEPKYVALQVVIDKMNDLFGAEACTASQVREFVQGLVQRLLDYPDLVNQTKVNSKKQFMESQDFRAAVNEAVVDNQDAHNTMADYFFSDGPAISGVIMALADAFYEAAIDQ